MDGYEPWKENMVYPGKHWLLYSSRRSHSLVGQIWFAEYYRTETGGPFRWEVNFFARTNYMAEDISDYIGLAATLDEAKLKVEQSIEKHQAKMAKIDEEREAEHKKRQEIIAMKATFAAERAARDREQERRDALMIKQQLSFWPVNKNPL